MDSLVLYDQKRQWATRRARLFRYVPYVDFVLLTGSLVLGGVDKDSDIDVLVGVKAGRLYTARFFCLAIFKLLGLRNHIKKGKSGFCFNYFVTPAAYCLPPLDSAPARNAMQSVAGGSSPQAYSDYDRRLYQAMAPLFGAPAKVAEFFKANEDWAKERKIATPTTKVGARNDYHASSRGVQALVVDDEAIFRWLQIKRIKQNVKIYGNEKSRIIYDDQQVLLWFNPKGGI